MNLKVTCPECHLEDKYYCNIFISGDDIIDTNVVVKCTNGHCRSMFAIYPKVEITAKVGKVTQPA